MAATPEGRVKDKIKDFLARHDCYYHMPVQNGMGKPSLDFVCCYKGRFFAIEAKAPGKKATSRQLLTMDEIFKAGGSVFVVDGEPTLKFVQEWLVEIDNVTDIY